MKKCSELIQDIHGYLDGEIAPELCAEIEKHLGDCHDCRSYVNSYGPSCASVAESFTSVTCG